MIQYSQRDTNLHEHAPLYTGSIEASDEFSRSFHVDLVDNPGQRQLICELLDRMYGWRGYQRSADIGPHPDSFTFAASIGSEVMATLTLNVDSVDGLASDSTFSDVLEAARQEPGAKLCELTKFASQPSVHSRPLLASLFHTIFIFGTERFGCTDLFIEVNPRHIRFYEAMLGFKKCADLRTNHSVDAPSQLMHLKVQDIGRYIELWSQPEKREGSRSLYPLFLPECEQRDVQFRMRQRHAAQGLHAPSTHPHPQEVAPLLRKSAA